MGRALARVLALLGLVAALVACAPLTRWHDAAFTAPHQYPPEAYSSVEEWAMIEARRAHRDTRDNCLDVANTARAMLSSQGIESEVVTYDTRAKGSRLQHAALCTSAGVCLDNGTLAVGLFQRGEPRVPELSRN